MKKCSAIILAAGEGKRMKSKHSKVSHKICGKPMVQYVVNSVKGAMIDDVAVVVGHRAEEVKGCIKGDVTFVLQEKQAGTGHAVMCCEQFLEGKKGTTLVLYGDTPLISKDTIKDLVAFHNENNFSSTVLTANFKDPAGYGRIVRDTSGNIQRIIEDKDATEKEREIKEINSGIYCFDTEELIDALKQLHNDNSQGEYYLTDTLGIIKRKGLKVGAFLVKDSDEVVGINSRIQLADVAGMIRAATVRKLMADGVTIIDPGAVYIDADVSVGMDTIIYPGTVIEGHTKIGEDCIIGPGARIVDSIIRDGVEINHSVVLQSEVKSNTHVGPFAYIRPESVIGENVKIGDFVEVKKSSVGSYTKVSHLTYIGDSEVGENVNFGCGTITVNYDGKKKNKTIIGDNAFIGCNTNLIAPVKVNDDSYIAAGSTITDEVPEGSLAIARERQTVKEGWVKKKNLERRKK
ncbi:MAG: bifunctional UDP-N-acetylglucosamine diphosphorylase/glucosamine-1-phosphate N-acetyltransferase GlmU [Clostridiales bacterium]|nr:bifunctional UDP-N-acetylglucosamine diphosphorylase/glucosamine-1-phosphate N-acetyltransferase GlmU [Clostridiales bacterium]HBM80772.1 bifunctional UDP-N-acetylglucosamine diphosphorylase/glucosamine-1-phosphate N-acetyltransferase GlmU [Clostridiaceae bacterium]